MSGDLRFLALCGRVAGAVVELLRDLVIIALGLELIHRL